MKATFAAFLLLIAQPGFGQDCNTQAANKAAAYVKKPDFFEDMGSDKTKKPTAQEIAKMKSNLDKAESWLKSRLTGFTGANLLYYNNFNFNPLDFVENKESHQTTHGEIFYNATGMKGYYYGRLMFFEHYCYDNKLPVVTEDESGSRVLVVFNNVLASDLCTDVGVFTVNGKFAFKKFEKVRSEGRIDFYERRVKSTEADQYPSKKDFIVIRNSDKPVFIPITRKEYLEQMVQDIQVSQTKRKALVNSIYETRIKDFENEISVYKAKDKTFTPEKEAKRRKWFNEDVNPEKLSKEIKKIDDEATAANQIIAEYLGKSTEWLSRGFSSFYPFSLETYHPAGVREYFEKMDVFPESREDFSRTEIVSINPAYFNNALGRDVPQLILVNIDKGRYPHMRKVATLIKQPGTLAPLEAIIHPDH